MLIRFFLRCLLLFLCPASAAVSSQFWTGYEERLVPYLSERGVDDPASFERCVREDLSNIEQSLQLLSKRNSKEVLQDFLGDYFFLVEEYESEIDHVGKELLGPLSFYLPLLQEICPPLGFVYLSEKVFASTSVVKLLQKEDPNLKGVTIARVYLQQLPLKTVSLELFQASPMDEKEPQSIRATQDRLSRRKTPIDHLAIRLNSLEEVKSIHQRILTIECENFRRGVDEIAFNPGDGSFHTKALIRSDPNGVFDRLIEFIYYKDY